MDVTLRSALTSDGEPQRHAADEDGALLVQAWHGKENTCPDLVASERCRLVVLAIEMSSDNTAHCMCDATPQVEGTDGC